MKPRTLYPVFLDIQGRRTVVVGGGRVAERKARGLLAAGANVTVVAREATAGLSRLGRGGKLVLRKRRFSPRDLDGAALVICATDDARLNREAAGQARSRGVPVNVADSPGDCEFFLPAVVTRGALQIAVSTGGSSPATAKRIREELEERYGAEYGELLKALSALRERVIEGVPRPRRAEAFRAMTGDKILRLFVRGDRRAARKEMEKILKKYLSADSNYG